MMTRRDGVQQKMLCVTLESLMPQEHFLRRLDSLMDFSFIYQRVESLYSHRGRPSIDPVVVVKMLLLGYMYGIDSERRLEQEVRVNIAYRWFLGIDLDEPVPDHSTFSQLRRRKFNGAALFEELFDEVVRKCIEHGLIDGKLLLTDSTHVRANARNAVMERDAVEAEPSAYLQKHNERECSGLNCTLGEVIAADSDFRFQAGGGVCGLCVRQLGDTQRYAGHGHTDVHTKAQFAEARIRRIFRGRFHI